MNQRFKLVVVSASTVLVTLLLLGTVLGHGADQSASDPYRHISVFTEVFSKIKSDYVEDPDMKNVTLGAINGLLVSIDPFSSYLNASQYKSYLKAKESPKPGVGLVLSRKYGFEIGVVDAIPGSPADKAGLATGDIIEAINGISTRDMPLAFTDVLLQGDAGSTVELTVLRLRRPEPTTIKLTRAKVALPALASKLLEPEIGYIQSQSLEEGRTKAIGAAVAALTRQGAKKMILDLRHAAVAPPEEGIALAQLFLEKGTIATLAGQKVSRQVFEADPSKVVFKGPLVVLTNRGTTAGAEIAALGLQENKRAQVVGERTYGDAAVRRAIPTEEGGAVLLAVAKYHGPDGKPIQDSAVTPAVTVADLGPAGEEEEEQPAAPPAPLPGEDMILKKGLEVLKGGVVAGNVSPGSRAPSEQPDPDRKLLTPAGPPKPEKK